MHLARLGVQNLPSLLPVFHLLMCSQKLSRPIFLSTLLEERVSAVEFAGCRLCLRPNLVSQRA